MSSVYERQADILQKLMRMKSDFAKRADKVKLQDAKYREMPDIVVKVVCRYRAELFFKISRKTKLSRLINSWTERMERNGGKTEEGKDTGPMNGTARSDAASTHYSGSTNMSSGMQFIFTYNGRMLEADQTPEEVGIDEGDEIVAVELMDLTEGGGGSEQWVFGSFTQYEQQESSPQSLSFPGRTCRTPPREAKEELVRRPSSVNGIQNLPCTVY